MDPCKQCGAQLPENAQFCMQCGSPVQQQQTAPSGNEPKLDFFQPALAGGMLLGLLSSIPIISFGNFLCCMWVLVGGGLAAYMLTKQRPGRVSLGDGAFAGVLSGLIGALVATLASIPIRIIVARSPEARDAAERVINEVPDLEGPARELLLRLVSPEITFVSLGLAFFMNLIVFSLFAMIGGILTIAILKRKG